ncbi:MAG: Lrp/AsnC family transcriptional regulator [Gammaproteobacteria bacterium]|nr:Lrp/AsnC family transcriptional regulator [Gammaproteobacteria bacterium]
MSFELTKQDIAILDLLQNDASLSSTRIAEVINLSQSPCWRRINRIEKSGLIKKRVALLDRHALGMELVIFASIKLTSAARHNMDVFEADIASYTEVQECYTIAGIWDYMIKIVVRDIRHYEQFVRNTLTLNTAISELNSHIAVTEIKNTTELPIHTQL